MDWREIADKANGIALCQAERGAEDVDVRIETDSIEVRIQTRREGCVRHAGVYCTPTAAAPRVYPAPDER